MHRQWPCALGDWAVGHRTEPKSSHESVSEVGVPVLLPLRQWAWLINVSWICGEERIVSFTVEVFE